MDEPVTKGRPLFWSQQLFDILFDPIRVFRTGQTQSVTQPLDVRIDKNCLLAESSTEHDACRFSAHSLQRCKLLHRLRNSASKSFPHMLGTLANRFRLLAVESRLANEALDLPLGRLRKRWRIGKLLEERRCNLVHHLVRRLRRQNCCHEKLPGVLEIQLARRIGVCFLETCGDSLGTVAPRQGALSAWGAGFHPRLHA